MPQICPHPYPKSHVLMVHKSWLFVIVKSLPLSEFEPMLIRLLERRPYAIAGQLNETINQAKAALNCYDFDTWMDEEKHVKNN